MVATEQPFVAHPPGTQNKDTYRQFVELQRYLQNLDVSGGSVGPQGPPGPQGPAGPQGVPGTDGIDGTDGATGPQGPKGDPGADGADGQDGAQGPVGPEGPQGPAGSLSPADEQRITDLETAVAELQAIVGDGTWDGGTP